MRVSDEERNDRCLSSKKKKKKKKKKDRGEAKTIRWFDTTNGTSATRIQRGGGRGEEEKRAVFFFVSCNILWWTDTIRAAAAAEAADQLALAVCIPWLDLTLDSHLTVAFVVVSPPAFSNARSSMPLGRSVGRSSHHQSTTNSIRRRRRRGIPLFSLALVIILLCRRCCVSFCFLNEIKIALCVLLCCVQGGISEWKKKKKKTKTKGVYTTATTMTKEQ